MGIDVAGGDVDAAAAAAADAGSVVDEDAFDGNWWGLDVELLVGEAGGV